MHVPEKAAQPHMNEHLETSVSRVLRDLSLANRILYAQGVLDAFGHVSVRHPANASRFLISKNRAPALVGP